MSDLHDLAPLFAVGALDAEEERNFLSHLEGCADCQEELRLAQRGIEALALSSSEPAPPEMRATVLDLIDRETAPPAAKVVPRRGRFWQAATGIAAAAAVVFAVLFFSVQGQVETARQIEAVLAAPDLVTVTVADSPAGPARFSYSASLGQGVFTGIGMAPISDDQTYQLWLIDEEGPASAGVFRPDEAGDALVVIEGELGGGVVLGLTVEPAGGSPQPTGDVLIAQELA